MCTSQWTERMLLKLKCHYPLGWEHRLNRSQKSGPVSALRWIVLQQVKQFPQYSITRGLGLQIFRLQIRYTLAIGEASRPSVMVWGCVTAWFCSQPSSYVIWGF